MFLLKMVIFSISFLCIPPLHSDFFFMHLDPFILSVGSLDYYDVLTDGFLMFIRAAWIPLL